MSEMNKCNTGISLTTHNITAVSSSSYMQYNWKEKNSPISGLTCVLIPAWDFAAGVASPTEQITWWKKNHKGGQCYICSSNSYN